MKTSQWRLAVENRYVFSARLKLLSDRSSDRSAGGRRFHVAGPLTAKLRCPVAVWTRGTSRVPVLSTVGPVECQYWVQSAIKFNGDDDDVWWCSLFRWSIYTYETSVVGSRQLSAAVSWFDKFISVYLCVCQSFYPLVLWTSELWTLVIASFTYQSHCESSAGSLDKCRILSDQTVWLGVRDWLHYVHCGD